MEAFDLFDRRKPDKGVHTTQISSAVFAVTHVVVTSPQLIRVFVMKIYIFTGSNYPNDLFDCRKPDKGVHTTQVSSAVLIVAHVFVTSPDLFKFFASTGLIANTTIIRDDDRPDISPIEEDFWRQGDLKQALNITNQAAYCVRLCVND